MKKYDFIYGANRKFLLLGAIVQIIIKIQFQSYYNWENHAKFSVRNTLKCIFHADTILRQFFWYALLQQIHIQLIKDKLCLKSEK